jgi:hypothetical protein
MSLAYRHRVLTATPALLLACLAGLAAPAGSAIIPDSTVLARVGPRVVTAGLFVDNWVAGNAMTRPGTPDSSGRHEFLNTLVSRELLRLAALERNKPLDYGDRLKLAQWREDVLKNALYVKMIRDSVVITDDDIRLMHVVKKDFLDLRRITCRTRGECEGIRARLVRGEPWSQLVKLSIDTSTVRNNGRLGAVMGYLNLGMPLALELFKLQPGSISPVLYDRGFWHVYFVERHLEMTGVPLERQYRSLREEVRRVKEREILSRAEARFAHDRQVKYDAANLSFAAKEFAQKGHVKFTRSGPEIDLSAQPEFAPADTSRTLATSLDGTYTLGAFLDAYLALSPITRPSIQSGEDLIHAINSFMFQPYLLRLAREQHVEESDYFKEQIRSLTERLMLEQFYADSVERLVQVTPEERRAYYEKHKNDFFTYPQEHLFVFFRPSEAWARGLADSLRRGLLQPVAVVKQDSLLHPNGEWSEERLTYTNEKNDLRVLFNEMKDGEIRVIPAPEASTVVLRVEQRPGHQLSLSEVESFIAERVTDDKAELLLQSLLARLRRRYPVQLYTDHLMELDLTLI